MSTEVLVGIVGMVVMTLVFLGGLLWVQSLDDPDGR